MTSTHTVANAYAEKLLVAKDKQKATVGILERMNKLRYKGHTEPLPVEGKRKIIALIRAQVMEGTTRRADKKEYSTIIAYMLEHVSGD